MLQEFQLACCEANSYFKSAGCRIKPTLVQLAKSLMAISSKKKKKIVFVFFLVCVCVVGEGCGCWDGVNLKLKQDDVVYLLSA